jgi:hypothetical protein
MGSRSRRGLPRATPASAPAALTAALLLAAAGCYGSRHALQWASRDQIWLSEASQVKVRAAQSRVFDTPDRTAMLEAVVDTVQDLGFQIEVLDPELGIVSAKKYLPLAEDVEDRDATYLLYDEESLVVFQKAYRTWGPFWRRSDLVRLTVTVRRRNEKQLVVRASAQHFLRPVEDPEPYQRFYAALEQALFAQRSRRDGPGAGPDPPPVPP